MEENISDADKFRGELRRIFLDADRNKLDYVIVKSKVLHNLIFGDPPSKNQMPNCCRIMHEMMEKNDIILSQPPSGQGATVNIQYFFPRNK